MTSMRASDAATTPVAGTRARDGGFPGAAVTGACLVAAPLLAVIASVTGIPWYAAKGTAFLQGMADHRALAATGFNLVLAAMMLLIIAVVGLAQMVSTEQPHWGRCGGLVTVIGLCGPLFFNGVYFAGYQLAGTTGQGAGANALDQAQMIPRVVMNVSGPALVIGFVVLAVGAAKAGVLSRPAAVALGLTLFIPAGFISGYLVITGVAFAFTSAALVPLGIRVLREHVREPRPGSRV